jgi:hypothetical protein
MVIKEGPRTVDLFIGERRGTLNGSQRAEVLSFAAEWRREATGGILIDVPPGISTAGAAASAAREVRAILSAAGVPSNAMQLRETRAQSPAKLVTLRLLPARDGRRRPCGLWPHDQPSVRARAFRAVGTGTSVVHSAISPRWSRTPPPGGSLALGCLSAVAAPQWRKYHRGEARRPNTPTPIRQDHHTRSVVMSSSSMTPPDALDSSARAYRARPACRCRPLKPSRPQPPSGG